MANRILVLGAGGFIGQHLVRALSCQGHLVTAVSRRNMDSNLPGVRSVVADLREPEKIARLITDCRAVAYLASLTTPGTSVGRPIHEVTHNVFGIAVLLQVLQDHPDVSLLYFSSGGALYTHTSEVAAKETTQVHPRSYHGAGKIAAEAFIEAWCSQYAGTATILRPSNIYGPGQPEHLGFGIVPTAFGKIMRNETLGVWGDGSAVRDYLYIDDLVALSVSILATQTRIGFRLVNACSGEGVSLNELFDAIETVTGQTLLRTYETARAVDALRVVMNPALANEEYGCLKATSLHEGLERTWAWLKTIKQ
jgi:UDP-glucose 4-epimerase